MDNHSKAEISQQNYMNKIGIATFHRAINYGALLQAYALQEAIKRTGGSPVVIDYALDKTWERLRLPGIHTIRSFRDLKSFLYAWFYWRPFTKRVNVFRAFVSEHLLCSRCYRTYQELSENPPDLDCFVCGSDQIWNPNIIADNPFYLLGFVPDGKIIASYAPSLCIDKFAPDTEKLYRQYLSRFQYLSVREEEGSVLLKEIYGLDTSCLIDPTLLLSKEEWRKIEEPVAISDEYLLTYSVINHPVVNEIGLRLAHKMGIRHVHISLQTNRQKPRQSEIIFDDISPGKFLWLFRNAKYTVTSSYHGLMFSLINQRPFLSLLYSNTDKVNFGLNARMPSILNKLELLDRIITLSKTDDINDKIDSLQMKLQEQIDYNSVERRLKKHQDESYEFLRHFC